jgi:hypothetical protein
LVLLGLLGELVLAAEVPSEADFEEDEGTIFEVKGGGVRGRVDSYSSGVENVRVSSRSCQSFYLGYTLIAKEYV